VTRVWEQIVQSATAKGRVYNADAASKCLAEATAAFARCSFAPDLHTCARVFTGKAGPGESCTEAADCADRPNEFASCTTKTCAYTPALRLGERCGASSTPGRCEYPLRCMLLPDAVEAHCAERGSIGAPCREHLDCDDGLYCDTATGACAKGRAYGERCEMDPSRCLSTSCDAATDTCTTLAYCKR
jgi:hypothetical protein